MFYLIRHGEPDYTHTGKLIYQGRGIHYAPLTDEGVKQIKCIAADPRLVNAEIIVSSPYTRTLQSAAILSRILQLDILIEPNIYEWSNDTSYLEISAEEGERRIKQYNELNGDYPEGAVLPWESNELMRKRFLGALKKYRRYGDVIVVCHGMLIRSLFPDRWPEHGEIIDLSLE